LQYKFFVVNLLNRN